MTRRLVAAIACRNQGTRLYAKPIQNLDVEDNTRILDNIINCLETINCIDEIVLGIAEGIENEIFKNIAKEKSISHMDAVLWYCQQEGIEPDTVGSMITKGLKEKIEANARDLNFLPKQAQLPI